MKNDSNRREQKRKKNKVLKKIKQENEKDEKKGEADLQPMTLIAFAHGCN